MNIDFAHQHGLKTIRLARYIDLNAFNGTTTASARVTHSTTLYLTYENYRETITMYLTTLGKHDFILGQPWNHEHQVQVDYDHNKLLFTAEACQDHLTIPEPIPERTPEPTFQPTVELTRKPTYELRPTRCNAAWTSSPPRRWYD